MKQVLISDSHPLFRNFLEQKLTDNQISPILSQENRDLRTRMTSDQPDLIILDMKDDNTEEIEFLEQKLREPNCASIPVIITGPVHEKSYIVSLAKYGVIKYFAKPIQFDIFFEAIGKVLHTPLSMDTTPCVLDIHRNGNIIFVELALGLNREKLALLQFKLSELIEKEQIENPKIIVMLTNLELSFVDGYNLEYLIDNILACPKVHNKNVKILSLSSYVRDLLDGHQNYAGIEMSSNLAQMLNSLVDTSITSSVSDIITDKILTPTHDIDFDEASVTTRFSSDAINEDVSEKNDGTVIKMAIIDSNEEDLKQTMMAFSASGANCTGYKSGQEFLTAYNKDKSLDLIVLDVLLADKTGLSLLKNLQNQFNTPPIIIYSKALSKEATINILKLGAKGFILKPAKPRDLVQKSLSFLRS